MCWCRPWTCAGKSKRPRDIRNGCRVPFPINPWTTYQVLTSPAWTMQLLRNGMPITANLIPYAKKANQVATAEVMQVRSGGSHTWEELKRLREKWPRKFVVKGILHPEDAERAVAMGADGIWVSNHGGRHFDGAPASVDVLPAIVSAVGSRVPVMIDSGIRGGLDVLRALALGAKFCFTGRCFAYGWGARAGRRAARGRSVPRRDQDRDAACRRPHGGGDGGHPRTSPRRLEIRELLGRVDGFAERQLWNVRPGSHRLDARELDHLGPLFSLICNEFAELGSRERKRRGPQLGNP